MKTIQFKHCKVEIHRHYVQTIFEDGTICEAVPRYREEDIARAMSLGYDSVWEMCKEHEILHTELAEARGEPYSKVLYGVSHDDPLSPEEAEQEERVVLYMQRKLNYVRRRSMQPAEACVLP